MVRVSSKASKLLTAFVTAGLHWSCAAKRNRLFMWLTCIFIIATVATTLAGVDVIPINPQCQLSSDIVTIKHDTASRLLDIVYHPERRCSNPSLILRLSGPSLYKLDYVEMVTDTQRYQYPPMLDPGTYFLEAVVIFCQEYDADRLETQCLESFHFEHNLITLPYNFTVDGGVASTPRARWTRHRGSPVLLPTRHQRFPSEPHPGLSCAERYANRYCASELAELVHHLSYKWTGGPDWLPAAEIVKTKHTTPANTSDQSEQAIYVCFVGDSHARLMTQYLEHMLRIRKVSWVKTRTIQAPFPIMVNMSAIDSAPCSVAVLSFAIWPLARSPFPHTAKVHREQIGQLLDLLLEHNGPTRYFFRSENVNGLGEFSDNCPEGRDRRSPPAFDALNRATREVCAQRQVPFIDLDPIIYPIWDSGLDYCHPPGTVFIAELTHILHSVFSHVASREWALTTYPSTLWQPPFVEKLGPEITAIAWKLLCKDRPCL